MHTCAKTGCDCLLAIDKKHMLVYYINSASVDRLGQKEATNTVTTRKEAKHSGGDSKPPSGDGLKKSRPRSLDVPGSHGLSIHKYLCLFLDQLGPQPF
jgi:hypothetical protein